MMAINFISRGFAMSAKQLKRSKHMTTLTCHNIGGETKKAKTAPRLSAGGPQQQDRGDGLCWTIGALTVFTVPLALFTVAVLQGLAKLTEYRNDKRGRLLYPDGLTFGREDISSSDESEADSNDTIGVEKIAESADDDEDEEASVSTSIIDSCLRIMGGTNDLDDRERETSTPTPGNADHSVTPSLFKKLITSHRHKQEELTPIRVVVIGDSLAVGVGCIEQFEATEDRPMSLIENTKVDKRCSNKTTSPAFPQTLARTLSLHFKRPVHWRSCGVDGGDIQDIRQFCMEIVKQESARDAATIDIVLVIFRLEESWFGSRSESIRQGMEQLISDIRSHAPGALVVIPQIPICMDVFPLQVFWDGTLAFWERIKMLVANSKSNNSIYLELKKEEILDLYRRRRSSHRMSTNNASHHLFDLFDEYGSGVGGDEEPQSKSMKFYLQIMPIRTNEHMRSGLKWSGTSFTHGSKQRLNR
jgi:lysophospholipase L1-like esterase